MADINNEISPEDEAAGTKSRNSTYADNLMSLDNFIMALFDQDKTVVPKESSWFGSYAIPDEDGTMEAGLTPSSPIIHMKKQPLYKENWIGLKSLDKAGKVFLVVCEGEHMQLADECWKPIVKRWVGSIDIDIPNENVPALVQKPLIPPLLLQDW